MKKRIKLFLVAGARPNFVKIAPLMRELKKHKGFFSYKLVHTGQHYDYNMNGSFFKDLAIPEPDYFLNVGSGSHSRQTAKIMERFEGVCLKEEPDLVVVVGDVNSTLACSIVAAKLLIPIAHVEAGVTRTAARRIDVDGLNDGWQAGRYVVVPDRQAAIAAAIRAAGKDDAVLIAGKGHETYQILADQTIDFDDRQVARHVLASLTAEGA